jgi:hypothetical protein
MSEAEIQRIVRKPLSDADLRHVLGSDQKIIQYSDLASFPTLNDLLPKPTDDCIILYEQEDDSGHWVALMRYGNTVEYFDPYGNGTQEARTKSSGRARSTSRAYWNAPP